jgi:hypothetical protein
MSGFNKTRNIIRGNVNITGYLQIDGPIILNNDKASKKGGQLWDIISDRSTKKDINDLKESHKLQLVDAIKNMNIKTFKYIDDQDEKNRIGVIANELPESFNNQLPTGIKTVKMDEILFSMIVAYQSLNKEVEALREQLNNK